MAKQIDFRKPGVNWNAIIILSILVAGILIGFYLYNWSNSGKTVTASGTSTLTVSPDKVSVYFMIETRNYSAQTAKNDNAQISADVTNALVNAGIKREDIETESFNLYPEYDWTSEKQELKGYVASNSLKVSSKNFNDAGQIVDAAVNAGALINGINFELTDEKEKEYKETVLAQASSDAKAKAEAVVSGLGRNLGSLVSASAPEYNIMPYVYYTAGVSAEGNLIAKQAATNIQPKNMEISASVTIVYRIK